MASSELSSALHSIGQKRCVVFDFDKSLVDANTDDWVPKVLAPDLLPFIRDGWRAGRQWTELMDEVAAKLFERGFKKEDFERALCSIPFHEDMFAALKEAAAVGCPVFIVSDANGFYISTILKHHGLDKLVTQVITNPSFFDDEGRLHIKKYCEAANDNGEHGCKRCPVNMCKSWILERKLQVVVRTEAVTVQTKPAGQGQGPEEATVTATTTVIVGTGAGAGAAPFSSDGKKTRILYVGDGSGDVCPVLSMHESCVACARTENPMLKELLEAKETGLVKAKIVPWESGSEVLAAMKEFLA